MPGLTGVSTQGVGPDVVNYLKAVAEFFGVTVRVTSGYRNPDGQAHAMFDNWVSLEHGAVYKVTTLPLTDRAKLEGYWTTAHGKTGTAQEKAKAKSHFLELAKTTVGSKSKHSQGRAIDVSRTNVDRKVLKAIQLRLHEVKEGKRTDIYHFESALIVPAVDEAMKAKWQAIKDGPRAHRPVPPHPSHKGCC